MLLSKIEAMGINSEWFSSYLFQRSQMTKIGDTLSNPETTKNGVPQGSILGPSLFSIFINNMATAIDFSKLIVFADDNYLLISGFVRDWSIVRDKLEHDICNILSWLKINGAKLNIDKSELLLVGSKGMLKSLDEFHVIIDNVKIMPKPVIKCLGIYVDSELNWSHHINHIVKKVNYNLRCLFPYREYFNSDKLKLLCETLCLSHIQYMSLVWGAATARTIKPVKKCIKSMARFVLGKRKFDPITDEMTEKLGWLLPEHLYAYRYLLLIKQLLLHLCPPFFYHLLDLKLFDTRNGFIAKTSLLFRNKYADKWLSILL